MAQLILVKHARPEINEALPPAEWGLSAAGKLACSGLADRLAPLQPSVIITSDETKAIETGELVAEKLKLTAEVLRDLHEHDRSNEPIMRSGEFISAMADFFNRPDRRVLGLESADEALSRFEQAVRAALSLHADNTIAIITHGTVIALFAAAHGDVNAFQLWRKMQLPSFAVFDLPSLKLKDVVDHIG